MAFKGKKGTTTTTIKKVIVKSGSNPVNLKKVYAKQGNNAAVLVWNAVPDYIYNGGWADSDVIQAGSLGASATAYMVTNPSPSTTVTVCKILVDDLASISGSVSANSGGHDNGTNGETTGIVRYDGSQVGYAKHTQGNAWEGGSFHINVSSQTGWHTITLECAVRIVQGDTNMNGGSGDRKSVV